MKRSAALLSGLAILIASASFGAPKSTRRPTQRNYDERREWDTRRPYKYEPTPPNNRPTGPIPGATGRPGGYLNREGAGNTLKSRVPYDKQRPGNGIYPDQHPGGIAPGSRIGSFGSGQSEVGFPGSGAINRNTRFRKETSDGAEGALPEGLQEALDDITNSWKKRDSKLIRTRFPSQKAVAVFQDGAYRYETPGPELSNQVAAGVEQLQTQKFELSAPSKESPKRYFVSGKHTFLDTGGQKRFFHVSYVLEQVEDRWQIAEYGVSQSAIDRHGAKPAKEESFAPGTQ